MAHSPARLKMYTSMLLAFLYSLGQTLHIYAALHALLHNLREFNYNVLYTYIQVCNIKYVRFISLISIYNLFDIRVQ